MRRFQVYRNSPPVEYTTAGLTNAGMAPDLQGVVFDDGTVAVRWLTGYRSHVIWQSWQDFVAVHISLHGEYGTFVSWLDAQETMP